MADDQPNRRVHFNQDPVSNIFLFQRRPPHIIVQVTPPSPPSSAVGRETSNLSPTRAPIDRGLLHPWSAFPPDASRSDRNAAIEALSGGNDNSSNSGNAIGQERWSLEHESDGIEDSRASQTKNASLFREERCPP
jgi:hypothetical protein